MLSVKNLQAWYGNVQAIHGIDLEVGKGELVTLIGSNGAGKSTTLKSIVGLIKKRSGKIIFDGNDISAYTPSHALARGIALVPEGRWIFPDLTVEENLKMGSFLQRDRRAVAITLEEQFKLFPILKERRRQKGGTLSGGEQQMLAISRALMGKPTLLFLDEPSLGLAPQLVQSIFSLIEKLNDTGISILLVEQNSTMALSIADRGYVIGSGKVLLAGAARDLLNDPKVQQAYLGYNDAGGGI
ncbi:High-affinity branched-chain amino acid transport ATP-binding protein BraG [Propionispora sp. 2/2-37]|uniref:ABC transporter ATP-binding protein n=1 Tax=Propionispora sp. 2/2-37 TaxID=1677858 RepID=UPI0006BB883C|nr:ABC transporter ATP-binding protein [Propionispora sp. 2/2-37]CUH95966.1 High-affinity branched-chain amino acid transport ATP-binding protein BraG [Propionispora sp. 2/2-37]